MRKRGKIISWAAMGAIALIIGTVNVLAWTTFKNALDDFVSIQNVKVIGAQEDDTTGKNSTALASQVEEEGVVLLKNNGTLPLNKVAANKVNVFGWSSTQWIYAGSGSGRVTRMERDFLGALKDYGIETNSDLASFYKNFKGTRPLYNNDEGTLHNWAKDFSVLYEPDMDLYSAPLLENAKSYSDTAFVVLSRVSGESCDAPKAQYYYDGKKESKQTTTERHYLEISQSEERLLSYVSGNYRNVIVLINSTNQMDLSALDDYEGIDAALLVGCTGEDACTAIAKILYGEVNPSGRTVDTYPYDFKDIPSFANSGPADDAASYGTYTNGSGLYPANGTSNTSVSGSSTYSDLHFVDYVEDIYVGYKWFETAAHDGYYTSRSNKYGSGYDAVVQYPFGYGLSYTSFEQKIESISTNTISLNGEKEIQLVVSIKNTGAVAGKEVVQIYGSRPYTKGGIEKPYIELLDFSKTQKLDPGETTEIVFNLKAESLCSYDAYDRNKNGFKGYELEKGDYEIILGKNAHEAWDSKKVNVAADERKEKDTTTGGTIKNRFLDTNPDGVAIDGSNSGANINYLSRAKMAETYPSSPDANRELTDNVKAVNIFTKAMANAFIKEGDKAPTFGAEGEHYIADDDKNITPLGLKLGRDYNDPDWDLVLDDVVYSQAERYTLHGYTGTYMISSIGKPRTRDVDGPNQVGSFNVSDTGFGYPNSTVLAQTWNLDLAYAFGKQFGKDALLKGYEGLYAPGVNLHRSPMCGRNYEYYSEDALLTGKFGARVVKGSINMGVYMWAKHLALYEQESWRDGLYTWLTEQNFRENYLKPFEIMIKEGGLNGIMTSYNRIGATWAGGCEPLLKGVLVEEWGYHGGVITDYADHHQYMNMDHAVRMGGTLFMDGYLSNGKYGVNNCETGSNTFKKCIREATKRNLYMYLNTKVRAADFAATGEEIVPTVVIGEPFYTWRVILFSTDGGMALILGLWLFFTLKPNKKKVI